MTRTTNARLAGFTFLFYIAAGITNLTLSGGAMRGNGTGARLASIAQHTTELRVVVLLSLPICFSAMILGVTLYALTRDEDRDLALFGLICRVAEGLAGLFVPSTLALIWLATTSGAGEPDSRGAQALAAFLLKSGAWSWSAAFFAVGSTVFSWLLLRGRMIPVPLAWLGVVASAPLALVVPLQVAGLVGNAGSWSGSITWLLWMPMLVFELTFAAWLIVKGASVSHKPQAASLKP
jgi:uncharacterized protein DUF4386